MTENLPMSGNLPMSKNLPMSGNFHVTKNARMTRTLAAVGILAILAAAFPLPGQDTAAQAQARPPAAQQAKRADPFGGFGGNSKDPIRIDADRLEVFDKEQKAIYTGDVVAVRGTTTTRSTVMTIFYDNSKQGQGAQSPAAVKPAAGSGAPQDGALKRIEFKGPVSVVNGSQTATANEMVYDAVGKTVTLKGNAVVADGPNVQRGELMVYKTEESIATITNPGGRVQGVFTPGSQDEAPKPPRRTGQGQPTN
jgi:lipopolysaccharide export system protein LptA